MRRTAAARRRALRRVLPVALLLAGPLVSQPAAAQGGAPSSATLAGAPSSAAERPAGDPAALAAAVRDGFVAALAEPAGPARAPQLEALLAELRRLATQAEAPAGRAGSQAAAGALALLRREGITADIAGIALLDARLPGFDGSPAAEEAAIAVILGLSSPAHRAAAWRALAEAHARIGNSAREAVLIGRALDDGLKIDDLPGRAAALEAVFDDTARRGDAGAVRYAWPAFAAIADAPFRARAVAALTAPVREAALRGGEATLEAAEARLATGDRMGALAIAVAAIGPDGGDEAKARRERLVEAFLAAGAVDEAVLLAASARDRSDQDPLLSAIAARLSGDGEALAALPVARLVVDGGARARALLVVADRLRERGYTTAAKTLVEEAVGDARGLAEAERRTAALVTVGRRLALLDTGAARAVADELGPGADRDRILSMIAKALGDAGRTDEALSLARSLGDAAERGPGIAAAARQLARRGDRDGAVKLLGEIAEPADRDRVLVPLAEAESKAGEDGRALARAEEVSDPGRATAALMDVAAAAARRQRDPIVDLALERVRTLAGLNEKTEAYPAIVRAWAAGLAAMGEAAEADAVAARLPDADIADAVAEATAARLVAEKRVPEARAAAERIADLRRREEALAAIAVTVAGTDLHDALEAVRPLSIDQVRVKAFREIAEAQAARLDRLKTIGATAARANTPPPPARPHQSVYDDRRLTVGPVAARIAPGIAHLPIPDLSITAADLRARMPAPTGTGDADVTPIRYNQFNDKFLQEAARTVGQSILVGLQRDLNPFYINLDRGVFTLGDVHRRLVADGHDQAIERIPEGFLVRLPILVGPEATLVITGEEAGEVRLGSDTGAFLVAAGALYVLDTRLVAWSERAAGPDLRDKAEDKVFRPFLTAWSDSEMYVGGSTVVAVGYPAGKAYGISYTAGPIDLVRVRAAPKPPAGAIVENTVENAHYGFYSYEAEGVSVIGNEYRDNVVYGVDPHDRSKDLRIAYNTLYGTHKKHGLIISREVDDSFLVGNVSFDNEGSGIMLDRDSASNIIYANTLERNRQDGITFFESPCNLFMANLVADNARSGVRIRNSWDVALLDNLVRGNGGAGVDAYISDLQAAKGSEERDFGLDPYVPIVTLHAEGNVLDGNKIGVTTRGVTAASFADDAFANHGNRIFRGDLAPVAAQILQYGGKDGVRAASACRPKKPVVACRLRDLGLLPADDGAVVFDPEGPGDCTGVAGSLQQSAFTPEPAEAPTR